MTETVPTSQSVDRERVLACVLAGVRHVVRDDDVPIDEHTRLLLDLGLDSTNVLELLMEVEDALAIELDADSLEQRHFETVRTLSDHIAGQLGAGRG